MGTWLTTLQCNSVCLFVRKLLMCAVRCVSIMRSIDILSEYKLDIQSHFIKFCSGLCFAFTKAIP